jgi:Zn-dependent protease
MTLQHVHIVFELIVFLFAISVHESAHAWMANLRGDPTARMLGRVTLNPLKHIDPVGTVLLPLIAAVTNIPMLGWAKPTPIDPRNFKNLVLDDILTTLAGPASNFTIALLGLLVLIAISFTSPLGAGLVHYMPSVYPNHLDMLAVQTNSVLMPISLFVYELMIINIVLGVFNLIPIPPLDGSHVLRHFLPEPLRKAYDTIGWVGLLVLVYFAPGVLSRLISPAIGAVDSVLIRITS